MSDDTKYASVVVDSYLSYPLDYIIPKGLQKQISSGSRVQVPLKNGLKTGYVWEIKKNSSFSNAKSITAIEPALFILPDTLLQMAKFVCSYYGANPWQVLRYVVSPKVRKEKKTVEQVSLSLNVSKNQAASLASSLRIKSSQQAKVLDLFLQKDQLFLQEVLSKLSCSTSPVETLIKKKILIKEKKAFLSSSKEYLPTKEKILQEEQLKALTAINIQVQASLFKTFLLFGITGSGKTEIYLQAAKKALSLGKAVLILVPEIALTSQLIEKFQARLQQEIAVWHHKKSDFERFSTWQKVKEGKCKIIIGARSAVFCPASLGLIIVDEEHDSSYKQMEEMPCYNARDLAVYRGKLENACVVLGSATPSLESFYQAEKGKYSLLQLKKRAKGASVPTISVVDQKMEFAKAKQFTHFSSALLDGIKKRMELGEQTLLYLNRRGFHKSQLCTSCGKTIECSRCSISLTYHKKDQILLCHLCGHTQTPKSFCPHCKKDSVLQFKGFGTEHVEASLHAIFPNIRTLRMDRDTTTRKNSHEEIYFSFRSGKADVLIGTQMISKGFDFPSVTLVGILQPDLQLSIPDFRAEEFFYQQIVQVAGRAGRGEMKGEVIIQTFCPNHPIMPVVQASDYQAFYKKQLEDRKMFSYPPFVRIIKLLFTGREEGKVKNIAFAYQQKLDKIKIKSYPPTPCGYAKIKDKYRFQVLLFTEKVFPIIRLIRFMPKLPPEIHLLIDVDPLSTF